LAQNA
jgi:hypothetical protein